MLETISFQAPETLSFNPTAKEKAGTDPLRGWQPWLAIDFAQAPSPQRRATARLQSRASTLGPGWIVTSTRPQRIGPVGSALYSPHFFPRTPWFLSDEARRLALRRSQHPRRSRAAHRTHRGSPLVEKNTLTLPASAPLGAPCRRPMRSPPPRAPWHPGVPWEPVQLQPNLLQPRIGL